MSKWATRHMPLFRAICELPSRSEPRKTNDQFALLAAKLRCRQRLIAESAPAPEGWRGFCIFLQLLAWPPIGKHAGPLDLACGRQPSTFEACGKTEFQESRK